MHIGPESQHKLLCSQNDWLTEDFQLKNSLFLNLDFEWCRNADKGLPTPDAVFYLDIKPESTATRAYYGEELYEKLNLQQRVYNTYNRFKEESYWHTLDGGKEANVIHQEIWKMFSDLHENIKKNKTRIEENLWCSPSMKENSPSL
ncbi:thymidylate kinase [Cardiosporidium cionae]|uniref:Thymidylate kinase n=1 Tax=Cardiosporidium cionae TaxID=476202 RepID=A0ABQ7JDX8_9APIC|nr:thymidylate kinase [Cardiosporidium cionae]|eukprot:KAF8822176.1 thymidylate kinase [Cardiosporidium cionae]